ncbi:MAG: RecX family transcriptional regulator [Acholeplasmatales bacterium]|nr:RecX family transcriptional regulator [Acholeplasmatales bacterium]
MIYKVTELKKNKKGFYDVTIDKKKYELSENIVVEYRLVKDKEIDSKLLSDVVYKNELDKYYNKAIDYTLKYQKGSKEIEYYLEKKGLNKNDISYIIDKLKEKKVLNDNTIIKSLIYALYNKQNGRMLIRVKLLERGFKKDDIEAELSKIDFDAYFEGLQKLYKKIQHKYDKYDDYKRIHHIKSYLYQRGYLQSEIDLLNIK